MHFEREALNAMLARIFGGILPVRNDFFSPLPVLHLGVFGRPAIGDPVRLGVLRSTARATGKADDHFYIEDFGEEDGLAKCIDIFLGMLGIGMNGIAVTTESGDANPAVFKFFQPGFGLSAIVYQVVEGTMTIVWIAPGADLHGFQAEGGDFIQHGVEGEMVVNGIEHADRDFVQVASWLCRRSAGNWILGICR